jgi:hypothetical protein
MTLAFLASAAGVIAGHAQMLWRRWPRCLAVPALPALVLGLAGVAAGVLALAFVRSDLDDVNYLGPAVFFAENPRLPLDLFEHNLAPLPNPVEAPFRAMQGVEFLWGGASIVTGISALNWYHVALPAAASALVVLAWYYCLRQFGVPPTAAVVGSVAILSYLCTDASTHRAFGNFAIVRIWQGKALLLSLALPIFTAASLAYFRIPKWSSWALVFLAATGSASLSASAAFLVPLLAGALAAAHAVARPFTSAQLRVIARYLAALGYLAGVTAFLRSRIVAGGIPHDVLNGGFPRDFLSQLALVWGDWPSLSILFAVVCFALSGIMLPQPWRLFLVAWIGFLVLLVLNPVAETHVAAHLTTSNTYWRCFYLLPFPCVVGLATALAWQRYRSPRWTQCSIALLLPLVAVATNLSPRPGFGVFSHLRSSFASHKLAPDVDATARRLSAVVKPGPMLAPLKYAAVLPLFTSAVPQVAVRDFSLGQTFPTGDGLKIAESRRRAIEQVAGQRTDAIADIRRLLDEGVVNVLAVAEANAALASILHEHGFIRTWDSAEVTLYIKYVQP